MEENYASKRDLEELRSEMHEGFEKVDKRFEDLRDDMNKRFEQVDKRFDQMFTFLWILTGIFTTLTVSVIGLCVPFAAIYIVKKIKLQSA